MKKKYLVLLTLLIIIYMVYLIFNPMVFVLNDKELQGDKSFNIGDTVNLFSSFNFDEGEWEAYILINDDDRINISEKIPKGDVLLCKDRDVLNRLQRQLYFIYTGTDMATVDNKLILRKNKEIVFVSALIVDQFQEGMQNSKWGFLQCSSKGSLNEFASYFNRVYLPIIIIF